MQGISGIVLGISGLVLSAVLLRFFMKQCNSRPRSKFWSSEATATGCALALVGLIVIGLASTIKDTTLLVSDPQLGSVLGLIVGLVVLFVSHAVMGHLGRGSSLPLARPAPLSAQPDISASSRTFDAPRAWTARGALSVSGRLGTVFQSAGAALAVAMPGNDRFPATKPPVFPGVLRWARLGRHCRKSKND